tara:strand:- start:36 stop:254 length:219 start_codon:yes stop_codon:yes gene_type:complete
MTNSALSVSGSSSALSSKGYSRIILSFLGSYGFGCISAFLFLIFAVFFASDQPEQLGSICEKHNPVVACRVW